MLLRNTSPTLSGATLGLALGFLINAVTPSIAHADAPLSSATNQYVDMCMNQATSIPAPYGEADLKGNPGLGDYCKCFGAKFAERAVASVQSGGKSTSSLDDTVKEEQAMRNSCRKQVGLPLLKFKP
ncbi:hypothetical protein [Dyella sp.]|nr:hypothetical protein [Dyella sp.]PMQ05422.1 hypothetical protein DyAD56_08835 [Dyella sp. AD56]ULU24646.1 hypothetical protein DYST_01566 [Dyella terrae]